MRVGGFCSDFAGRVPPVLLGKASVLYAGGSEYVIWEQRRRELAATGTGSWHLPPGRDLLSWKNLFSPPLSPLTPLHLCTQ